MATIVDNGLEIKAKLLNGLHTLPLEYMGLGSSSTAEATNQTALVTEHTTGGAPLDRERLIARLKMLRIDPEGVDPLWTVIEEIERGDLDATRYTAGRKLDRSVNDITRYTMSLK